MRRPALISLLAVFVLSLASPAAQAFPEVGISQSYRDFGLNLDKGPTYEPDRDVSRSVFWGPLSIKKLRVIVPWDIADRGPGDGRVQEFVNWLKRAKELEAVPFVVFGPTERTPSTDTAHTPAHFSNVATRCCTEDLMVPPKTIYRTAIEDFLATWGPGTGTAERAEVRTIGAWNEPNVDNVAMSIPGGINGEVFLTGGTTRMYETLGVCPSGSSTESNCGPLAAAYFWNNARAAMAAVCSTCTVVGGEFDSDGLTNGPRFWKLYAEKIELLGSSRPQVMSFHGHHDVEDLGSHGSQDCTSTNTQYCTTRTFSEWLKGKGGAWASIPIWDTEVGAQHSSGTSPSTPDVAQRNRFNNLINLENTYGVSRFYYYNFQHQSGSNDRSLIDSAENGSNPGGVNTRLRPIWDVIRCRSTAGCEAWVQPAPVLWAGTPTVVTQTSAQVPASITGNGHATLVVLQYSPTTSYGWGVLSGSTTRKNTMPQPAGATFTGLQPGTTYHYRLRAVEQVGESFQEYVTPDQTFTTSP